MAAPIQVAGEPGHQVAGAVPVKERAFLVLQHLKQPYPQVVNHVLRRFLKRDNHQEPQAQPGELDDQHPHQQRDQRIRVLCHDDVVHQQGG